jgi:tetratricopeptide (TPR) repeat protein
VERLEYVGVPFLKFHPTLARVLWVSLAEGEQRALQQRHRERYHALSEYVYNVNDKNPRAARAIVHRELPNLLVAVRGALVAGDEWAVEFVHYVNRFLNYFGMNADSADLTQLVERLALSMVVGSQTWFLARNSAGARLYDSGQPEQAKVIFEAILARLGETVSYERCSTLCSVGGCWNEMGQPAQAATLYRQALVELARLEPSDAVKRGNGIKREMSGAQRGLGGALMAMGHYGVARQAYEASLAIDQELDDESGAAVSNGQLGTLAMVEGNLAEAETRYQSALTTFRTLDEPAQEAIVWLKLGKVYEKAKAWEQAEQAYRTSAQIKEAQGNLAGAAHTWHQLAIFHAHCGKPKEAEAWFRKALKAFKADQNIVETANTLNNLAHLLQSEGNLPEARQLAEEALTLKQTLDPAAAAIWLTHNTLAEIATQQGESAKVKDYRRQSRQSYAAFGGSRQMLQKNEGFIQGVVAAMSDAELRQQLEAALPKWLPSFATAIQQILAGARDEDELCDELNPEDAAIVLEILQRL